MRTFCAKDHESAGSPRACRRPGITVRAMAFYQTPPELGNQYRRRRRAAALPAEHAAWRTSSRASSPSSGGRRARRRRSPSRVHRAASRRAAARRSGTRGATASITSSSLRSGSGAARITAEKGIVATAYERKSGAHSRVHQFALVYLIDASWHVYSCPLAMTDGAARTLIASKNQALIDRAVPRLTSRNPDDVVDERPVDDRAHRRLRRRDLRDGREAATAAQWRLHGTKWFSSRDDVADGAHARPPRGQSAGRQRARALLRRGARRPTAR